jgi:hypothetical protein
MSLNKAALARSGLRKIFPVQQNCVYSSGRWAYGLQLTYIYMLSRKHMCSRKHVLDVEQGCSLLGKIEQCPGRVRVGVVM